MRIPKLTLFVLALTGLAILQIATGAVAGDDSSGNGLAGHYDVSGMDHDGDPYEGTLEITQLNPAMFRLAWNIAEGHGFVGKAALVGNTLSGAWGLNETECFIVLYQVDSQGVLDGVWVSTSGNILSPWSERAVPAENRHSKSLGGAYLLSGSDGTDYRGTLEITELSPPNRFLFRWDTGRRVEGVGTLNDGEIKVVASHSGDGEWCGGTVYHVQQDGQLLGKWWMSDVESHSEQRSEIAIPN